MKKQIDRLEQNGIKSVPPGAFTSYKKLRRIQNSDVLSLRWRSRKSRRRENITWFDLLPPVNRNKPDEKEKKQTQDST
ncbi:hypothetical protein INR49_001872 [Caranx melampygus]|nr:hypothetical protein INR49_001872 [Caranx melampygus]